MGEPATATLGHDARPQLGWLGLIMGGALGLSVIAVALVASNSSAELPAGPEGTEQIEVATPAAHVPLSSSVDYGVEPPAGGDHVDVWQNCGIYDEPLTDEQVVHSMEHGAVWVTYRPDLPMDEVKRLRGIVRDGYLGEERYVVLSPYEELDGDVVASAWGHQLRLASADDPRLAEFVEVFAGGVQSPEKLFPCKGGEGSPLD